MGSVLVDVLVDGKAIFGLLDLVRCRCGTIAGNDCSLWVDDDFRETALVVSRLVVFVLVGCTNSNKMGNKEFKDGFFSFNEGISLC